MTIVCTLCILCRSSVHESTEGPGDHWGQSAETVWELATQSKLTSLPIVTTYTKSPICMFITESNNSFYNIKYSQIIWWLVGAWPWPYCIDTNRFWYPLSHLEYSDSVRFFPTLCEPNWCLSPLPVRCLKGLLTQYLLILTRFLIRFLGCHLSTSVCTLNVRADETHVKLWKLLAQLSYSVCEFAGLDACEYEKISVQLSW